MTDRLVVRIGDLPRFRLLVIELEALLLEMKPGPERDRLERALRRLRRSLTPLPPDVLAAAIRPLRVQATLGLQPIHPR